MQMQMQLWWPHHDHRCCGAHGGDIDRLQKGHRRGVHIHAVAVLMLSCAFVASDTVVTGSDESEVLKMNGHWWRVPLPDEPLLRQDQVDFHQIICNEPHLGGCGDASVDDCKVQCLMRPKCAAVSPSGNFYGYGCARSVISSLKRFEASDVSSRWLQAALSRNSFGDTKLRDSGSWYALHLLHQPRPTSPGIMFPNIWPLPLSYINGTTRIQVSREFKFIVHADSRNTSSGVLKRAIARYKRLTFLGAYYSSSRAGISEANISLGALQIHVRDNRDEYPQLDTNEEYSLHIPDNGNPATLIAANVDGCLRGLETFSQLVEYRVTRNGFFIENTPWKINDRPRFKHRGLLVDTSRHFISVPMLKRIITQLPYAKLNVLHWHMTDTHAFPMEVRAYDRLWNGAHSLRERYSQVQIAHVVSFARDHGVKVMLEVDTPGHAASWCIGYPEVCPSPSCNQPLNVASETTYQILNEILNETVGGGESALFPYELVHLGGDEVEFDCWKINRRIMEWLDARSMSVEDGYGELVLRASNQVSSLSKTSVHWDEAWTHFRSTLKLPNSTVIHLWTQKDLLAEILQSGHRVILSNSDGLSSWYLDLESTTWHGAYSNEPCEKVSDELCKNVLGGQGQLWGERVDAGNLESMIWPRLAAIAERLWSQRDSLPRKAEKVKPRLAAFRCLLVARGVGAAALDSKIPRGPGSCGA